MTHNRRGDANCSDRLSAADLVAAVRGAGGHSVCGNDDCDRDHATSHADVSCTAECLFGQCPIPPYAPAVTQVSPGFAPQIVPLSVIRILGNNFGSEDSFRRVIIGGIDAPTVETDVPGELWAVVPNLPPGPTTLRVSLDGLDSTTVPLTIVPPAPIGAPDSSLSALLLLQQLIAGFLTFDLEGVYGIELATAVRESVQELQEGLIAELEAILQAPEFRDEDLALIDASIESSGIPERLRAILADLDDAGARGAGFTAKGGGTVVAGAVALNIGQTIAAAAGLLDVLGSLALPHLAALAHLLGISVGVLITLASDVPTAKLTPVLSTIRFVDASASSRAYPTGAGYAEVRIRNLLPNQQVHLIATTSFDGLDLLPQATGIDTIQYQLPPNVCGRISFAVENSRAGRRSRRVNTYIQPEILGLSPTTAKPKGVLRVDDRGVRPCEGVLRFFGRSPGASALECQDCFQLTGVVPNLLPADYKTDVIVAPIPSRERRNVTIELAVTGAKVACALTELTVPPLFLMRPSGPLTTQCTATPEPAGTSLPPGAYYVWTSSDTGTATVRTSESSTTASVTAELPGTTKISAVLNIPDNVQFTSNEVEIEAHDRDPPRVEVSTTATSPVPAGSAIPVHVRARDNVVVTRIILQVSGDAATEATQEIPCLELEESCEAEFTVNLKAAGFHDATVTIMAQAVDGSGNTDSSPSLVVQVMGSPQGDTHCPDLTIQSPTDGSVVAPGTTVTVVAPARDDQPGDTGVAKFNYSASGDALVANVGPQDLAFPAPLPQPTLRFNFEVKSEAALASVANRTINIRVQAFDAAMPPHDCGARTITVTASPPPMCSGRSADEFGSGGGQSNCSDGSSRMELSPQPTQGYYSQKLTMTATISGPAAAKVVRVKDADVDAYALPRQPDGSFRGLLPFAKRGPSGGPYQLTFEALDAQGNPLCCASTTVTGIGPCMRDADCGSGVRCLSALGICFYSDCLDDFDCPDGESCIGNGTCVAF